VGWKNREGQCKFPAGSWRRNRLRKSGKGTGIWVEASADVGFGRIVGGVERRRQIRFYKEMCIQWTGLDRYTEMAGANQEERHADRWVNKLAKKKPKRHRSAFINITVEGKGRMSRWKDRDNTIHPQGSNAIAKIYYCYAGVGELSSEKATKKKGV